MGNFDTEIKRTHSHIVKIMKLSESRHPECIVSQKCLPLIIQKKTPSLSMQYCMNDEMNISSEQDRHWPSSPHTSLSHFDNYI